MSRERTFHLLLPFFGCLSLILFCGCPRPTGWTRVYGGAHTDKGYDVQQTSDGGFVVAGQTYSFGAGDGDMYLLRLAANGDVMWSNTYGGLDEDTARRVVAALDGGYVIAGSTSSFGAGHSDACLVKMDSGGSLLWNHTYGTDHDESAYGLAQTGDGGYLLAGGAGDVSQGERDILLVKTDADGAEEWSRVLDYGGFDWAYGVVQTTDGGYAIVGTTVVRGGPLWRVLLVKTDADGNPQWSREFGDAAVGYDIRQTSDGGYVMAGVSSLWSLVDPASDQDGYMVKTDADGVEEWSRVLDSPAEVFYLRSVRETSDGGLIFAGDRGDAAILIKTALDGTEQWSRTYGASDDTTVSGASAVIETWLGGYCFAGAQYRSSTWDWSVYVVRTDALGSVTGPVPVP